jgi:predicted amidophosphoribosyltransferase
MTCPQCGQDNPTVARFCNGCGARLPAGFDWPHAGQAAASRAPQPLQKRATVGLS